MNLLSRSALVASVAAAGLLASSAVPGNGVTGCLFSKFDAPQVKTSGDSSGEWQAFSPDSNALGAALGGLGAIAALLTVGTVLLHQRWLAAAAADATLDMEADLSLGTETETVLVFEPAEIESEVALAYRR
ncbi:hypothetical protein IQ265_12495 [Nodosilinea sp. LEGE 06152]|uniref:hypothetical protein n=1 Tax=Nodosilinea sp. LEGE 06152 TaxID=2777966 RepID=UPI00187E1FA8|nr:hypothetical protein [Nodosilinea sp. LEGE 06152]MBE9157638.1 hypothetical protein [Nodosilinea sp. LEGE 06152]